MCLGACDRSRGPLKQPATPAACWANEPVADLSGSVWRKRRSASRTTLERPSARRLLTASSRPRRSSGSFTAMFFTDASLVVIPTWQQSNTDRRRWKAAERERQPGLHHQPPRGTSLAGPPETMISSGAMLAFIPINWQLPQAVTLAVAPDPDADDSTATLTLSASGLPAETVPVL